MLEKEHCIINIREQMKRKILIIGGTRFLGLEIAKAFINKGEMVYTMNRGTKPPVDGIAGQIVCDIKDRPHFAKGLRLQCWDIIIDTILTDEDLDFAITELGDNVGHFIHTGSLGVYGEAKQIPALESQPLQEYEGEYIVFNYKIRQDQVIMRAFQERAFPGTILRMSYIYGSGDILLDGWGGRSDKFFQMLRDNKRIVLPSDGRALLHPGHVKDLGRAFLHAAECPDSIGQIYNIGGSQTLMMKDYVAMIASAMQVKPNIEYAPLAEVVKLYPNIVNEHGIKFSCQHMSASIAKAECELNWRPEISLSVGISNNIEWMKQQKII
jgi:nucleoside-diphosphate-sugar epimerase